MSDLKPCPFCGSEPQNSTYYIECDCDAEPKICKETLDFDESKAIKAWNQRPSQWQDISTAPRDGTEVLLGWFFKDKNGIVHDEAYIVAAWYENMEGNGIACWMVDADYSFTFNKNPHYEDTPHDCRLTDPTHWMPLPEPPKG